MQQPIQGATKNNNNNQQIDPNSYLTVSKNQVACKEIKDIRKILAGQQLLTGPSQAAINTMTPSVKQRSAVLEKKGGTAKSSINSSRKGAEKGATERSSQLSQKEETGQRLLQKFVK